jgi:hypothetical protein
VAQADQRNVSGAETVIRYLRRSFGVLTAPGGRRVNSIDGISGGAGRGDWSFYVNGIAAARSAAVTSVHAGDRIWWDRHDGLVNGSVPAVVGSFPEPFVHGIGGKRLPTVLGCASDVRRACDLVGRELKAVGIPVAIQLLGGGSGSDSLALEVGTWADLHGVIAAELVDKGPAASGVYAQFVGTGGQALELDDPHGNVVETLHGDAGLIAATEQASLNEPTWLVTGTDPAGVAAAAAALTPARLHDHFALAVSGGRGQALPLHPGR